MWLSIITLEIPLTLNFKVKYSNSYIAAKLVQVLGNKKQTYRMNTGI